MSNTCFLFVVVDAGGKLKIRGIHVCPAGHVPLRQGLHSIVQLSSALKVRRYVSVPVAFFRSTCTDATITICYVGVQDIIGKKSGALSGNVGPNGAFGIPIDRIEQALDMLREAAAACGVELGHHVSVVIDYGKGC
jgi:enolase